MLKKNLKGMYRFVNIYKMIIFEKIQYMKEFHVHS